MAPPILSAPILSIESLGVSFRARGRWLPAVTDVSLAIGEGETYALVGESGCGKSTVAMAALRYLPRNGRRDAGRVVFEGQDLFALDGAALERIRGDRIGAVYQNPGAALNPALTVGAQIAEVYVQHRGLTRRAAWDEARAIMGRVRIVDPDHVVGLHPHELSGGMQQRVVIAMALATDPALLVLDEPTTALDTTVQAEMLRLFETLRREFRASLLFISHNLGVVRSIADRIGVMYGGEIVEEGRVEAVLSRPRHPYTAALVDCVPAFGAERSRRRLVSIEGHPPFLGEAVAGCIFAPRCPAVLPSCREAHPPLVRDGDGRLLRCPVVGSGAAIALRDAAALPPPAHEVGDTLLEASGIVQRYGRKTILRGVDLSISRGETLGLVGESGSGKSTLARVVTGLTAAEHGAVRLDGRMLASRSTRRAASDRRDLQMVFQSPDTTLNPRHRVGRILRRAVARLGTVPYRMRPARVTALLDSVRLSTRFAASVPARLSGGQRQRIAIARAFAGDPRLVILDEPTSALDVSVQAAILNLLVDLQRDRGLGYLFISHDLGIVRYVSDRIGVMYQGEIVEIGPTARVFDGPRHPYTRMLIDAVPHLDAERARAAGAEAAEARADAPPGEGCRFRDRCPLAGADCAKTPPWRQDGADHAIRCWRSLEQLTG